MSIRQILKENVLTRGLYSKLSAYKYSREFRCLSLVKCKPYRSGDEGMRINVVLPLIRKNNIYGGISTALKFFSKICEHYNCDARIITTELDHHDEKRDAHIPGFSYDRNSNRSIVYLKEDNRLDIRKKDIFIYSSWDTAYIFSDVLGWQIKEFGHDNVKSLYLIQDYEPGFYAWSTKYVAAESTYRKYNDSIIAVFNSKELKDYFDGYEFYRKIYFKPEIPDGIKKALGNIPENKKRKKQILIYGRPSVPRNGFTLIRDGLTLWSEKYKDAERWSIISLGEKFDDIRLKNNVITSFGKVSLDEYSRIMSESYAGISLMISPHPSYPPLEMSTFGVRTITNSFANKDLSDFNDNIISMNDIVPERICDKLIGICDEYSTYNSHISKNEDYVNGLDFDRAINEIIELVDKIV